MRRSVYISAIAAAAVIVFGAAAFAAQQEQPVLIYLMDARTGSRDSGCVTERDFDSIIAFVRSIPGIDHFVQEVDGVSWPAEVHVLTGEYGAAHGSALRLQRRRGRWVLLHKDVW